MKKLVIKIGIIVICLCSMQLVFATPSSDLGELLEKISTMQADFVQTVENDISKSTTGKMALARPGKFRWETATPAKQLIIANDDYVWVYDPDLSQATKRRIDYQQPGNPAMLLSGTKAAIQKAFKVSLVKKFEAKIIFKLIPRVSNSMYQAIKLSFVDGNLIAMYMVDNLGQESEIRFANVVANTTLAPKLFTIQLPPNTDIIEE
jgi:outer membrane lipoprotein carrier protein